jgi:23S rRNA (guanosine2251-2'-O)-methyltransferase
VSREQRSGTRARHVRRDRGAEERGLVCGRRAVAEAVRAGTATEVLIARGARRTQGLESVLAAAASAGIGVREVSREELDAMSDDHRGVVARRGGPGAGAASRPRVAALGERELGTFPFAADAVAVVLDGIEDPQNLGAAARSAEAAGAAMLVTRVRRAAPITAAAVRASAGALEHLPHARVANVARAIGRLQGVGFFVVGLDHASELTVYDEPCPSGRVALVLGSESTGLSRLVKDRCDVLVGLPLLGRVDSLNAAAALAAVLYAYVVPTRIGRRMEDDAVPR